MAIVQVFSPARKFHGKDIPAEPTDYAVEIVPGKSISIYKKGVLCTSFGVGDPAEYDSFNLSYTGPITKITDKCISITKYPDTPNACTKMLKLYEFCWRNHDFDAAVVAAKNAETSMHI